MGHDSTGFHVIQAELDAFEELELPRDIGGNRFAREERFAAPGMLRQAAEPILQV